MARFLANEEARPGAAQSSIVVPPLAASAGGEMDKGEEAPSNRFVIAALGASAGGLEALENFFSHTPPDTGIGFIVVQHLAPDHRSSLPELLARRTEMLVEQARDNATVEPNHVYIIPRTPLRPLRTASCA